MILEFINNLLRTRKQTFIKDQLTLRIKVLFRKIITSYIKYLESVFLAVHEGFVNLERVFQDDCLHYAITSIERRTIRKIIRMLCKPYAALGESVQLSEVVCIV